MNERNNKTKRKTPATSNTNQKNKLNYSCIFLNNTIHFLYKVRWRTLRQSPCRNKLSKFIPATTTSTETITNLNNIIYLPKQKKSFDLVKQHLWLMLWLLATTVIDHGQSFEMTTSTYKTKGTETSSNSLYSHLLSTNGQISLNDDIKNIEGDDIFRPFEPKDMELISRNVFTPSGQFRVFQPIDTDLRFSLSMQRKSQPYGRNKMSKPLNTSPLPTHVTQNSNANANIKTHEPIFHQIDFNKHKTQHHKEDRGEPDVKHTYKPKKKFIQLHKKSADVDETSRLAQNRIANQADLKSDFKTLETLLVDYVTHFFEKGQYKPMPGLLVELQNNRSQLDPKNETGKTRTARETVATDAKVKIDLPRTLQTGRLLFLTGLKKVLWPVFMGLQVLKSLLIAMFIPAIIGSFTKLLGKGITTGSAPLFIRPLEPPQELDFRDNTLAFEEDHKFLIPDDGLKVNGPYAYNHPDASQMHNEYVFDPSSTNNQLSYTRLGMNERQHQLMQDSYMNALQNIGSASFKNSGSLSSGSSGLLAPMVKKPLPAANVNTFQQFQNVPDSSLLLSNYDPFYSPLLSRLDSVFAQLKINSDKEMCREKLICLMYANPAKYAPYSNLVSAQLSRELNELRKPTSDNPDILRFFKYMRAAKDGQDGVDCEKTFDNCTELKDFSNPAMVSTYHDINKLVQARKLASK